LLSPESGKSAYIQAKKDNNNPFKELGRRYQLSVWLKTSTSNNSNNSIDIYFNGVAHTVTPTNIWKQYSFEQ